MHGCSFFFFFFGPEEPFEESSSGAGLAKHSGWSRVKILRQVTGSAGTRGVLLLPMEEAPWLQRLLGKSCWAVGSTLQCIKRKLAREGCDRMMRVGGSVWWVSGSVERHKNIPVHVRHAWARVQDPNSSFHPAFQKSQVSRSLECDIGPGARDS